MYKGILFDFDGTLVEIAPRPELVAVEPKVREVLEGLADDELLLRFILDGSEELEAMRAAAAADEEDGDEDGDEDGGEIGGEIGGGDVVAEPVADEAPERVVHHGEGVGEADEEPHGIGRRPGGKGGLGQHDRPAQQSPLLRPADARHPPHLVPALSRLQAGQRDRNRVRRPHGGRSRSDDRGRGCRHHRRLHRRADPGHRRHRAPARRLLGADPEGSEAPRHPADRRRGCHRVRAAWVHVRLGALRAEAGFDHDCQGLDLGLCAVVRVDHRNKFNLPRGPRFFEF